MSLILDAIKKSERERNKTREPELQSIHNAPNRNMREQRNGSRFVLLLLAVAILAGGGWWLWPRISIDTEQPAAQTASDKVAAGNQQTGTIDNAARYYQEDDELPPRNEIKELWELPADYQSTVPEMEFSFHVFSREPDKRTIIINGRRLREGQMVARDLRLRSITENGVIFYYRGRFFHIDVIERW